MKLVNITPVFEKDDRTDKSNYRLISILPNLSNVFSKCIYNQLSVFFDKVFFKISLWIQKRFQCSALSYKIIRTVDNQIKGNEDKSHVLTSTQEVCGNIGTTQITNNKWEIYEKVGAELNALTRIANHMPFQKRKVFMNAFFTSQFSYCPLTWMFHSRKLNIKINNTISLSCHDQVFLIRLRFERYFSHLLPSSSR